MKRVSDKEVFRYVDGELGEQEAEAIRRASRQDPALKQRIDRAERLHRLLAAYGEDLRRPGEELDLWPAVRARLEEPERSWGLERLAWFFRWHRGLVAGALAACAALALALGLFLSRPGPGSKPAGSGRRNELVVEDYQGPPPTVFQVPGSRGETTVLWVQVPKEEEAEDSTEPEQGQGGGSI